MVELFDTWVHRLGDYGYLVVGLGAMLEYLVPPLPGDTVLVLGGAYAVRGEQSLPGVFLAVEVGSVLGLSVHWWLGRALARKLERSEKLPFRLSHERLTALQASMKKRGDWILAVNRFVPSVRALVFIAAGASHIPYRRAVAWGALSAAAWNVLLLTVGYLVGGNAERLGTFVRHWEHTVIAALGVAVVLLVLRWWLKRRRPA